MEWIWQTFSFARRPDVDKMLKASNQPNSPDPTSRQIRGVVVNLKSAKALGIDLPTSLLLRANEVIE